MDREKIRNLKGEYFPESQGNEPGSLQIQGKKLLFVDNNFKVKNILDICNLTCATISYKTSINYHYLYEQQPGILNVFIVVIFYSPL